MQDHPSLREEQAHLSETLTTIRRERVHAEAELQSAALGLQEARRSMPDALPVREMLYARAEQTLKNLDFSAGRPYFTRIDFVEKDGKHTYYIGRWGVLKADSLESVVTDWRAPVANLYYSGQIGPMRYAAPDGVIEGELTLKRQPGIERGELNSIFDVDLATADALLQKVLSERTSERLRDIVTTIQSEQNLVIRHPLEKSMVVQGAPGSGKTTVALHRIAYLLYAYPKLQPDQMVILAPSPLFLNFIAGVLPDLGVERVRQTTFEGFLRALMDLPKLAAFDKEPPEQKARDAQAKGAPENEARLDAWLSAYERSFADREIAFGPVKLYDKAELQQFLLVDEAPFPVARRLKEFEKQLTARVKRAARTIEKYFTDEAAKRAERLRATIQNPAAAQEKVGALYRSLDERVKEVREEVKPFLKREMAAFPPVDPASVYRMYLRDQAASPDPVLREASERSLKRSEETRAVARDDLAALGLIALKLTEVKKPDARHLVIDEAQDFSALEFQLLARLAPGATLTAVGDLMQSIGAGGITDWEQPPSLSNAARRELTVSYRSTVEIMQAAEKVFSRFPAPGIQPPRTVLRHGDQPLVRSYSGRAQQAKAVEAIAWDWQGQGMASIAVIGRSEAALKELLKALPKELGAKLLSAEDPEALTGVMLASAAAVKGLEFDAVMIADAGGEAFPADPRSARLLYVCLTRALHKLAILYEGPLTPLLAVDENPLRRLFIEGGGTARA